MKFNLNHNVKVRLTQKGRDIHRGIYDDLCRGWKNPPPYAAPKEDAEGWSQWQLWCLMQDFGRHVGMGTEPPFELEIEIPDTIPEAERECAAVYQAGVEHGKAEADAMVAAAFEEAKALADNEGLSIPSMCTCFYGKHQCESCSKATARNIAVEISRKVSADARAAFEQAVREAVEAERERCAQVADDALWDDPMDETERVRNKALRSVAAAIRAPQEPSE